MGGTLPILVKFLVASSGRVGFHTAVPYAVNTLGAVTGCLATGFFALYFLGVKATVYAAGAADIVIGILVLVIFGRVIVRHVSEPGELVYGTEAPGAAPAGPGAIDASVGRRALNVIVLATFALSGFASLSYEVLWTRVFSLVLGSSIYAFTIILATFLIGIGAGSIFFAPFIDRQRRPLAWFAALEVIIGVSALLSIFLYRELPLLFFGLKESFAENFWLFALIQFLLISAIMIVPTLCMGAIFPLVGRIYTRGIGTVGRHIGDIYFFNTAGAIAGSFVAGFILIPIIGVQSGVILTVALNLVVAAVLVAVSSARLPLRVAVIAMLAVFFIGAAAAVPSWERMVMTTGLYVNPVKAERVEEIRTGGFSEDLVYYKEGINAVITVRIDGGAVSYQANGKMEARAEGARPAEAWSLLGHMPMLMHRGTPTDALVVGLGSGITLGAMEYYPLRDIDVIEIETAVVDASRFFSESNNNAIEDERVRLYITDGRSFLFNTPRRYDVIVSAVSDPWITGVSNLFTHEYFTELGAKLKDDDGIVSLWFQNYRITPAELKLGLNTFTSVFPYVSVWFHYTDALDLIVIGSKKPHSIGTTGLNTDERPVLEFTLPKNMYLDPALGIRTLEEIIAGVKEIVPPVTGVPDGQESEFYTALGRTFNRSSFRLHQAYRAFNLALEADPSNREAEAYAEALAVELGMPGR
jgi:spermidine synthase